MSEQAPPVIDPADELADLAIGYLGALPGEPEGPTMEEFDARADEIVKRMTHGVADGPDMMGALDHRMRQLEEAQQAGPLTADQQRQQKVLWALGQRAQAVWAGSGEKAQADTEPEASGGSAGGNGPDPEAAQGQSGNGAEFHHRSRQKAKAAKSAGGAAMHGGATTQSRPSPLNIPKRKPAAAAAGAAGTQAASGQQHHAAKPGVGRGRGAGSAAANAGAAGKRIRGKGPNANAGVPAGPNQKTAPPNPGLTHNQAPAQKIETLPAEIGVLRQIERELDDAALSFQRLTKIKELVDASVKNVGGNWIHSSGSRFRIKDTKQEIGLAQTVTDERDSIDKLVTRVIEKSRFEYHLLTGDRRRDAEEIVRAKRLDFTLTSTADERARHSEAVARAWNGDVYDYRAPVGAGERSVNGAISAEVRAALRDVQAMRTDRGNSRRMHGVVPHGLRHRGFRPVPEDIRTEERDQATGAVTRYLSRDEILSQLTWGERKFFERQEAFHARRLPRVAGEAERAAQQSDTQDQWRGNLRGPLRDQVMAEYRAAGHSIGEASVTTEAQRATMLRWAQLRAVSRMELHNQIYSMKQAQLAGQPNTGLNAVNIAGVTPFTDAAFPVLGRMRTWAAANGVGANDPNLSLQYVHALEQDAVARDFLLQEGLDEGVVVPPNETPAQRTQRMERARRFVTEREALKAAAAQRVQDYAGRQKTNGRTYGMWVDESITSSMPSWFTPLLHEAGRLAPTGVLRQPFKQDTPLSGGGKLSETGDKVFYSRT